VARDFEQISLSQAETLNEQAARIRELIQQVNAAKGEAESARILAGKYAAQAGVPADEESVRVAAEWDAYWHTRLEREHHALEMFQDEIIRNVKINYLQRITPGSGGVLTRERVLKVVDYIEKVNDACRRYAESVKSPAAKQPPAKSARPKKPAVVEVDLPDLFGGAA
jgi:hypothetical protein